VRCEVDADRHRHAAEPGENRERDPPPLTKLSDVELAARLEADDEEEERHQTAVHPVPEIHRDPGAADANREMRLPDGLVRRRVDVHPREGGNRRGEQEGRATGLGAEELPERRLEASRPGRPLCEGSAGFLTHRHGVKSTQLSAPQLGPVPDDDLPRGQANDRAPRHRVYSGSQLRAGTSAYEADAEVL